MKKGTLHVFFALILFANGASAQWQYPSTQKIDQTDDYFGTRVSDPYRWLENDTSADTKGWVQRQQAFTEGYLSKVLFRGSLMQRLKEVNNYPRYRNAFKVGDYIFYSKNDGLQNQAVFYFQKGLQGTPKVFLDPNTMSADGTVSVVLDAPSNDKRYLSWHVNRNGSDWSTSFITEIATGRQLPDSVQWMRGDGLAWTKDGFYYIRYPKPAPGTALTAVASHGKVFYHRLGRPLSNDSLVFEDQAHPDYGLGSQTTEDGHYLFIFEAPGSNGWDLYYKDLTRADAPITLMFKGYDFQYVPVDNIGDRLLVYTNDGADNFRVINIDPRQPDRAHWQVVIPERKEKLETINSAGDRLFAQYLKDASSSIDRYDYNGKLEQTVALPGLGSASGFSGFRDDKYVFYGFTSFTYPSDIFRYDIDAGHSEPFKKSTVRIDLDKYVTEQVFYTSKDGTKVPLFLVHKKEITPDSTHPTLLYAYGGFDVSATPAFNPYIFPLLENNGVYAEACIRGGGEYGETWHRGGMLDKKQNVFDDFIAAGEYLIAKGYTKKERLAIMGGSNGGLLIGAVMTQRPDLCQVAFPMVGVMDMLRFQKFTSGVFWTSEYGSSDSAAQFPILYHYSPLHNIRSGTAYPATLVMTADHDDRVVPMHSFKFGATLQEKQTGANPVLIRISTNQGHGASGSSLQKSLELYTDLYAFLFYNMGITPH